MTVAGNSEERLDDLDDLIRHLEAEKKRLKQCVNDAAQEWEFSNARSFAKAYRHVARRLRHLQNLKDPGFDERARNYRQMTFLEEQLKAYENFPQLVSHFKEQLQKINQALDSLENTKHSVIDTQHVDDALFQLVEGTIESFRICLNKSDGLILDFICKGQQLKIGFSYKKNGIFPPVKKRLRKIGFMKIEHARRFERAVDISQFKDAQHIKQLIAVIIFDVLDRSFVDKQAELQIMHKEQ